MKNKKILFVFVGILGLAVIILFGLRLLTPEDTWICSNGSWQKHGSPTAQMPQVSNCK